MTSISSNAMKILFPFFFNHKWKVLGDNQKANNFCCFSYTNDSIGRKVRQIFATFG